MADAEPGFGQSFLTGASVLGRVYTTIGVVIGVLIALILIIMGIVSLRDPHTATAAAVIINTPHPPVCNKITQSGQQNQPLYRCSFYATYVVRGKQYVKNFDGSFDFIPTAGMKVSVQYVPSHPANAIYEFPPKITGYGMILGGVALGGLALWWLHLVYKYKGLAAGVGALDTANLLLR